MRIPRKCTETNCRKIWENTGKIRNKIEKRVTENENGDILHIYIHIYTAFVQKYATNQLFLLEIIGCSVQNWSN